MHQRSVYPLSSPVSSYLCPHILNMKWKTSGYQYMDGLICMTAHPRERCKMCILPINLLRNHWCARNGFIMHIVCCLLNSVGDFNIAGVFGVVSFPRCVLRAPPSGRGEVLVFYSQSALVTHNISKGLQYVRALLPCVSGETKISLLHLRVVYI